MRKRTGINLEFHKNFSKYPALKTKMTEAAIASEIIINSDAFYNFIIGHEFQESKCFAECGDKNEAVFERLMSGSEILTPAIDRAWGIKVIPYYSRFSRVIGYTYPDKEEIYVNMKFYNQIAWTIGDCAGNMTHEWTHKAGFGHSFKRSWKWPFTVPYAVGNFIKKEINNTNQDLHLEEVNTGGLKHMGWFKRAWIKVTNFIF